MEERNPVLWDIKSDRLDEIAFSLFIEYIGGVNDDLHRRKKDHRASYQPMSDFLKYNHHKKDEFYNKAKIIIRKDKIEKIWKKI